MTEIPFGNPIDPQCRAEIRVEHSKLNDKVATATLKCETIFCRDQIGGSICDSGRTQAEAGLSAEFKMRNVVQLFCPKWKILRDAGEVPQTDLPDDLMPPFE